MSDSFEATRSKLALMVAALPAEADLVRMPTPKLRAILADAPYAITALLNLYAVAWRELEARGEDLSEFLDRDNEVYRWVRRIARGGVAAEAVAKFGAGTRVLRVVARLPIGDQKRLAADPRVPLLDPSKPTDTASHKLKSIADMGRHELAQVFDENRSELRTLEAQARYVTDFAAPAVPPKVGRRELVRGRLALDRETNRLRTIGPDADLENAIALLKAVGYQVSKPGE